MQELDRFFNWMVPLCKIHDPVFPGRNVSVRNGKRAKWGSSSPTIRIKE